MGFQLVSVVRRNVSWTTSMALKIVVELRNSCETFVKCARQKHKMTTCWKQRDISFPPPLKTHPDIEVDFFDDTTAVVQVQAQLVQAQAFLQKVTEVVLQKVSTGPLLD